MPRRDGEHGFTLIEVMIAALILVIGVLATITLVDGASSAVASTNARVGAASLARQIVEYARSLDYDKLTSTDMDPALRQQPGLASAGGTWTIVRRNVTYTVTTSVCVFDDPKDGLAPPDSPPANACTPGASAVAGAPASDSNPDDFRRVTVTLSWNGGRGAGGRQVTQTALIVNPSGGLGPRITSIKTTTPLPATQLVAPATTATIAVTTTGATSLHWAADDGVGQGDLQAGPTSWTINWGLGPSGTPCPDPPASGTVLDGSYDVSAQAFGDRGVAGDSRMVPVLVNRCLPFAPRSFAGGRNLRLDTVDFDWSLNPERDIVGYRLYDLGVDGARGGGDDRLVCPDMPPRKTFCSDPSPPALALSRTYGLVALDHADLANDQSALREGAMSTITVTPGSDAAPVFPLGATLTATVVDGNPVLNWTAALGSVRFYRIYRDGAALGNAYDRTSSDGTTYTDFNATGERHTYSVAAVSPGFNESLQTLGPVTSP